MPNIKTDAINTKKIMERKIRDRKDTLVNKLQLFV